MLRSRWRIGQFIFGADQNLSVARLHGAGWMARLSDLLRAELGVGFALTNLRAMRNLYIEYRLKDLALSLSWNHYKSLLRIPDRTVRETLEREAVRQGLSAFELEARIRQRKQRPALATLNRAAWDFYEARVIEFRGLHDRAVRGLDLGFRVIRSDVAPEPAPGTVVRLTEDGLLETIQREDKSY